MILRFLLYQDFAVKIKIIITKKKIYFVILFYIFIKEKTYLGLSTKI